MTRTRNFASILLIGALFFTRDARAQTPQSGSKVEGVWRGTSLCLVQPSACHDETVVYHIARMNSADSVSIDANKIVDGREENMGTLTCHFAAPSAQLTCKFPRGVWLFTVRGDSLIGELKLPDNTKFRDVRAARSR